MTPEECDEFNRRVIVPFVYGLRLRLESLGFKLSHSWSQVTNYIPGHEHVNTYYVDGTVRVWFTVKHEGHPKDGRIVECQTVIDSRYPLWKDSDYVHYEMLNTCRKAVMGLINELGS